MRIVSLARGFFFLSLVACGFTAEVGALRQDDDAGSRSPPDDASSSSIGDAGSDANDASARKFTVIVGPNEQKLFEPKTLTIRAGDRVEWLFMSSGHTLVAVNGAFCAPDDTSCGSPPTQPRGALYSRTFMTPGTFAYQCSRHSGDNMRGKIIVEP